MSTDHPCVITIDHRSKPRVLFSGNKLVEVDLPVGTRVIYGKPPLAPLQDVPAAIRYAINHPENSEPLYAKLRPGMKVTIAIDDISMPLPQMKRPDVREQMLQVVLALLDDYAITDVELIIATAFHRPMTASEVRRMVGRKVFDQYWPDRLYNHDAEQPGALKEIGRAADGQVVEVNRRAAESDLVIYLNLTFVPMNGGHKSMGTGLVGYKTLRGHHRPDVIRKTHTYMDPDDSALNDKMTMVGKVIEEELDVFHIESTINNRMFDRPLEFLAKNEDELSPAEETASKAMVRALQLLPAAARQAIFEKVPAPYEVIGVWAGECEATHRKCVDKCYEQLLVPVQGQSDIVIFPIPYVCPYSVNAVLNPLLVQVMAQGYLFNMFKGVPLVKRGGTLILLHPCSDRFDREQHAPYVEFFHKLLPKTRDALELHKKYERDFIRNPAYIQMYRTGKGYHPAHPFFMWYWGENGRQWLGRTIVVGADNEYIPGIMGWETAATMSEALRMARETAPRDPSITCFRISPAVMAEVTPDPAARPQIEEVVGEAK